MVVFFDELGNEGGNSMNTTEALKLALDDLIAEYHMQYSSFARRVDDIFKEALVAPEDSSVVRSEEYKDAVEVSIIFHEGQRMFAVPKQPAPVQEPVAWMAESKNGNVRFTNIGQSADQLESFGWTISPLYAAPFQFQPLTEEAVLECWKQVYEPGRREHDNATRMARAIEAAHGITKGQP
jgi:hypothetical protein